LLLEIYGRVRSPKAHTQKQEKYAYTYDRAVGGVVDKEANSEFIGSV